MHELSNDFWDCEFFKYNKDMVDKFGFTGETRNFLLAYGLPKNHAIFEKKGIRFYDSINFAKVILNEEEFINIGQSRGLHFS